jgi:hypothetical protein
LFQTHAPLVSLMITPTSLSTVTFEATTSFVDISMMIPAAVLRWLTLRTTRAPSLPRSIQSPWNRLSSTRLWRRTIHRTR